MQLEKITAMFGLYVKVSCRQLYRKAYLEVFFFVVLVRSPRSSAFCHVRCSSSSPSARYGVTRLYELQYPADWYIPATILVVPEPQKNKRWVTG